MERISKEVFGMAVDNPTAIIKTVDYGNSSVSDYTTVINIDGLYYAIKEERTYWKAFDRAFIEVSYYMFDNEIEALSFFDNAKK